MDRFGALNARHPELTDGSQLLFIMFSTYERDLGLEVSEVEITPGAAGTGDATL